MDLSTNQEPKKATKVCTKCGRELPVDQFSRRKTSPDGLQQWCKACHRIANKQANSRRQLPPPHQGRPIITACGIYTASAYRRIA